MPKVKVDVNYPTIDLKATQQEIHKTMTQYVIGQLRTWVAGTTDPIPVWSGAARASFLTLAAKAQTSITINPVAPDPPGSRITLGVTEATSDVFGDPSSGRYGWTWESNLAHIGIVEDRVNFVEAGLRAIENAKPPELPQPEEEND